MAHGWTKQAEVGEGGMVFLWGSTPWYEQQGTSTPGGPRTAHPQAAAGEHCYKDRSALPEVL